ncbi:chaplin family protein [Streptomyces sp. B1866]|uniref:chaplin n=1 Tax=Streptomyces sp. B1866 TaxID=3075431 RepID=UPI0028918289|nr:chaplin family protein [Streptomyces sp. B1866]MDT3397549.1 chaplin family protein [Streptomyces sp. B1866]
MRKTAKKGLITVAAASGMLAAASGYAHAGTGAEGSAVGSPGVLSGNTVQVPIDIPVNLCGNTINIIGLLNPASGNTCTQVDSVGGHGGAGAGGAVGSAHGSPGVVSGNTVQVPVHVPLNVCGNSVNVIGLANPASDNTCTQVGEHTTVHPRPQQPHPNQPRPHTPVHPNGPSKPRPATHGPSSTVHTSAATPGDPARPAHSDPAPAHLGDPGQLAETGVGALDVAAPAAAGMLLAGAVLYRRARAWRN